MSETKENRQKIESFCVPFEKLIPAVIAELHKVHPGALPINTEWRLQCGGLSEGSAVIWWVPSPGLVGENWLTKNTMVREVNWAGPCIDQGVLIGESEMFYYIEPVGFNRRKRIKKAPLVHTSPCQRCVDHPDTDYPNGYEG